MCMCCASGMVDREAETLRGTCTYVDESCICGHHLSKVFCTTVTNEECSGSQDSKFWGRTCSASAQETSAIAHCYYRVELLWLL